MNTNKTIDKNWPTTRGIIMSVCFVCIFPLVVLMSSFFRNSIDLDSKIVDNKQIQQEQSLPKVVKSVNKTK